MAVDAGSIYSEVRISLTNLEKDIAKLDAKFNVIAKKNASTTTTVKSDWQKAFSAIKIASVAAIAGITAAFKSGITIGASFEQSMANVASVAKATASDLADLNAAAAEAGETTRFTASEAADAMYSLASAGLDATDAIDALNGVLLFSGATQSDLATSSALIVSLLKQYNLQATDAGNVSNVLAAAIGNSLANMDKLRTSLQQTGSVAGALNIDIESTVGVLEALFDAGYTGEKAGTALRNIYSYLADSTSTVTQQLVGMGAEVDKINPQFNDMADIIDYLNTLGLDTGDVFAAFGNEIGGQMVTLLSTGGDAIRAYTAEVTGTTDAADMYATQNDTLSGSFDKLKSAIQNTAIQITDAFNPALKPMVDFLTSLVKVLNKIPEPLKVFLTLVVGGTATAVAGATAFGLLSTAIATAGISLAAVFAPITAVVAGVAAITTGIISLNKHIDKIKTKKFSDLSEELNVIVDLLSDIEKTFGTLEGLETFAKLASDAELSGSEIKKLAKYITNATTDAGDFSSAITVWADKFGVTREEMLKLVDASGLVTDQGIQDMINYNLDRIKIAKEMQKTNEDLAKSAETSAVNEKKAHASTVEAIQSAAKAKAAAFAIYDKSLKDTQKLVELGLLTEEEANEEKISANMTLIESLSEVDDKYAVVSGSMIDAATRIKILTAKNEELTTSEREELEALEDKLNATETAISTTTSYSEKLEDLNTSSYKLMESERARAIATIEASKATDAAKKSAVSAIDAYYDAAENQDYQNFLDSYNKKIEEIGLSTEELAALEQKRLIETIEASGRSQDEITNMVAKVNEYYDLLNSQPEADYTSELIDKTQDYQEQIEELTLSEQELRDLEEERAIKAIEDAYEESDARTDLISKIKEYYKVLAESDTEDGNDNDQVKEDTEELIALTQDYQEKLEEVGKTETELRAIEKQRAIDLINASEADDEAKTNAIAKLDEYYQALADNDANEIAADNAKEAADLAKEAWTTAVSSIESAFDDLSSLFDALSDSAVEALEDEMEALEESLGLADQTNLEEAQEELDKETASLKEVTDAYQEAIDAANASGDAATAASLESILAAQKEADAKTLLTYQNAVDKAAIEEEYAEKEAQIEYEYDLKSWKLSLLAALASAASAQLSTYKKYGFTPAGFAASAAGAIESGVQVATIVANKPALATGGVVLPSSGGVETIQAENGYGELSLNAGPSGDALLSEFAQRVASYGNTGTNGSSNFMIQLYMNRKLISEGVAKDINDGNVRINLK